MNMNEGNDPDGTEGIRQSQQHFKDLSEKAGALLDENDAAPGVDVKAGSHHVHFGLLPREQAHKLESIQAKCQTLTHATEALEISCNNDEITGRHVAAVMAMMGMALNHIECEIGDIVQHSTV